MNEREEELMKSMDTMIKSLQRIRFICERAQTFDMDQDDVEEILTITKKFV